MWSVAGHGLNISSDKTYGREGGAGLTTILSHRPSLEPWSVINLWTCFQNTIKSKSLHVVRGNCTAWCCTVGRGRDMRRAPLQGNAVERNVALLLWGRVKTCTAAAVEITQASILATASSLPGIMCIMSQPVLSAKGTALFYVLYPSMDDAAYETWLQL